MDKNGAAQIAESVNELISCTTNNSDNNSVDIKLKIQVLDTMDLKQVAKDVSDIVKRAIISKVSKTSKLSQTEITKNLNIDPKTYRTIIKKLQ